VAHPTEVPTLASHQSTHHLQQHQYPCQRITAQQVLPSSLRPHDLAAVQDLVVEVIMVDEATTVDRVTSVDEAISVVEAIREITHMVAYLTTADDALQHPHTMPPLARRMTSVHHHQITSRADLETTDPLRHMNPLHTVLHLLSAATTHLRPLILARNALEPTIWHRSLRLKKVAKHYQVLWIRRQRSDWRNWRRGRKSWWSRSRRSRGRRENSYGSGTVWSVRVGGRVWGVNWLSVRWRRWVEMVQGWQERPFEAELRRIVEQCHQEGPMKTITALYRAPKMQIEVTGRPSWCWIGDAPCMECCMLAHQRAGRHVREWTLLHYS